MNALLTTYPRTGRHILTANLEHSLDMQLESGHDLLITKNHDIKITILRDPLESITSWVCMELHFEDISPTRKSQPVDFYIKAAITEFIIFHSYALKNIDIFIKYEDVVDNMYKIINYLSKTYDINKTNELMDHEIISNPSGRHLVTSKSYVNYDDVFKKVLHSKEHGELGSSKVMEYYNLCLEKCIVLT
jgi:hypothetical protein